VSITIDWDGATDGPSFDPLEEGVYNAVITKATPGVTKTPPPRPKLEVEFSLPEANNRRLWRNYTIQPNALWALKQDLVALGMEVPTGSMDLDTSELIGLKCQLQVTVVPHWSGETNPDGSARMDNDFKVLPADANAGFGWN